MNREEKQLSVRTASVSFFAHDQTVPHRDPEGEVAADFSINFVTVGQFNLKFGSKAASLEPGCVFVTRPGLEYRTYHREDFPKDMCTSIVFHVSEDEIGDLKNWSQPIRLATQATTYWNYAVNRTVAENDLMAFEEVATCLPDALHDDPFLPRRRTLVAQNQLGWYMERVDEARRIMSRNPEEHHSLASLSRAVGVSRFHFARIFGELAGVPPHRFLMQRRLGRARLMIRDGMSVTEACFSVGFNHLGHFSKSYKRFLWGRT